MLEENLQMTNAGRIDSVGQLGHAAILDSLVSERGVESHGTEFFFVTCLGSMKAIVLSLFLVRSHSFPIKTPLFLVKSRRTEPGVRIELTAICPAQNSYELVLFYSGSGANQTGRRFRGRLGPISLADC